jgi:hypothetical protein
MVLRMIRNGSYIDCIESDLALALVAPGFASRPEIQPRKIHAVHKSSSGKLNGFIPVEPEAHSVNRQTSKTDK